MARLGELLRHGCPWDRCDDDRPIVVGDARCGDILAGQGHKPRANRRKRARAIAEIPHDMRDGAVRVIAGDAVLLVPRQAVA